MRKLQNVHFLKSKRYRQTFKKQEGLTMKETEIKEKETNNEPESMAPYVNEKVKYYLVALVVILCIITVFCVIFGSEKKNSDETSELPTMETVVLTDTVNT